MFPFEGIKEMVTIKQMISHVDTTTRKEIRIEVYCVGEVRQIIMV